LRVKLSAPRLVQTEQYAPVSGFTRRRPGGYIPANDLLPLLANVELNPGIGAGRQLLLVALCTISAPWGYGSAWVAIMGEHSGAED